MSLTKRNRRFVRGTHVRQLRLEPLEDRRMLAAITVNSSADDLIADGMVTLREAIQAANTDASVDGSTAGSGADTIEFDGALSGQTITLGGTHLEITEALTIDAIALAQNVIVDANQLSRIFNITAATGDFTLAGLTLTGGQTLASDESGGAIRSITTGNLTLDRSTVSGNSTAGFGAYGGGIYSQGAVTLTNSTVSGNSTAETFARGGGIYSQGTVTLTDSTVSGNSTAGGGADGGGISSQGTVTLTSSTVSGNFTTADSADGGGIFSLLGAVTLTDSTVSGNSTAGNSADGGGIYSKGAVTLIHSTITDNHANHANAFGGGIWNDNDSIVIDHSIVAGNTDGGSMNDIRPGTGSLNINFSLIEDIAGLVITGSNNITGMSANLGPLQNNGGPTQTHAPLPGSPAIDAGDPGIVFNPAESDQRGTPFVRVFDDPMTAGTGIDIGAYERQTVVGLNLVVDTTIDENDGDYSAGDLSLREAVGLANGSVGADTITFDAVAFFNVRTITLGLGEIEISEAVTISATALTGVVTIDAQEQSRIFNITATTGDFTLAGLWLTGGRTTDDSLSGRGGAVRSSTTDRFTIDQSRVSGNRTFGLNADGGAIYSRGLLTLTESTVELNYTEGNYAGGGGVYTTGGASISRSTISRNYTDGLIGAGGGIFSLSTIPVTLTFSTVSLNGTRGGEYSDGGGIYTTGPVLLTDSTISGNRTTSDRADGGGIRALGNVTITSSIISENSTAGERAEGGGIHSNGNVALLHSTVSKNSTAGDFAEGGGIFSGTVALTDSTVSGNSTTGFDSAGGGIFSFSSTTLTRSTVSGNSTAGGEYSGGGGIYSIGAVTLTHSTVSGNSTAGNYAVGGGILSYGPITLTYSTVTANHTDHVDASSGGIWNHDDPIIITSSILAGNTAGGGMDDIDPGTGSFNVSFSLIQQTGLGIGGGGGNILGMPANLGPLASNGGATQTHALLPGSPAIDAGDPSIVPNPAEFDQRGAPFVRVYDDPLEAGTGIDMGATERQTLIGFDLEVDSPVDENDGDYTAGDLSLREAVYLAAGSVGADTITFDAVVFATPQTISLGFGEIEIRETLTIDGPGQHLLTIDAQLKSRVFNITTTTGDFTLAGLSLTGGRTYMSGTLGAGGAIRSLTTGSLTIDRSTVSGNKVFGSDSGGGIYAQGAVTLTGSTVSENRVYGRDADGGGIFADGDVTLTQSTVSGNRTFGDFGDGGGVFTNGSVTLTQSTVSGNLATGSGAQGGGIRFDGAIVITHSTVTENHAEVAGGGISDFDGQAVITNSIVADNTAFSMRNDINLIVETLNIDFSLIGDTTDLTITGSDNIFGMPADLGPLSGNGGRTQTHALLPGSPAIDAGDPAIVFNPAEFDQREAPFARVFDGDAIGGARIDMGAYERQSLAASYQVVDTLVDEDNGDYTAGDRSLREVIRIVSGSVGADTINFDPALTGGTIFLMLGQVEFSDDITLVGLGADALTLDAQGMSGVIRIFDSATVDISGLTLTGGHATRGGAIRNSDGGTVNVINSTLSGNSATSGGGAIYNRDGMATVTNSTISGNVAVDSSGGAIGNGNGGTVTVTSSTISGNTAERSGGIHNGGSTVTVTSSTISGNWATSGNGGGISNKGFAGVTITSSTISGNTAEHGGGVYNTGTATIISSTISDNTATYDGGGIYDTSKAHVTLSIVAGNMAGVDADVFGVLNTDSFNLIGGDPMLGPLADNGGPTETHALLPGSPAIDAGDPTAVAGMGGVPMFDQRGMPFGRVEDGDGNMTARIDSGAFELIDGDFNDDGLFDLDDIDPLTTEIVGSAAEPRAMNNSHAFDLTGDGLVNGDDLDVWLVEGGANNPAQTGGNPFLQADANLDGTVNYQDFTVWNNNKFTSTGKWSQADWNADGFTDGRDFLLWNANKFQSSNGPAPPVLPPVFGQPRDLADTGDLRLMDQTPEQSVGHAQPIPSTAIRRIDAVFADSHQLQERTEERPRADAFDALFEAYPINSWVL